MPACAQPFLHKLDPVARVGTFVSTTPSALRATPFLDGRTSYWDGPATEAPLPLQAAHDGAPDRMIFHVGFCGSTLLARLLDQPGETLVLREPQALTDLATYKSALDRDERHDPHLADLLATVRAILGRRWATDERIIIKPSNWINNLLPDLVADPARLRPLFLTMERRAFARAMLRGGPARLGFAARACVHLANADTAWSEVVSRILALPDAVETRLLMLAVLLHDIQMALFDAAARAGGWGDSHWLSFEALRADRSAALIRAANALDISPPLLDRTLTDHSKNPGAPYSAQAEAEADAAIEREMGGQIDRALAQVTALH